MLAILQKVYYKENTTRKVQERERTMETNIVVGGILIGVMIVFFLALLGYLFGGKPNEPDAEEDEQEEGSPDPPL